MSVLDRYRQHIKDDEENRSSNYAVEKKIKQDLPNIIRIVDPDSAVEYFESWMMCDDKEKRPFIIENDHEGKSVLAELLGDRSNFYRGGILDSRLDEFKQKYYVYDQQDPELILRVAFNEDKSENAGNWKPRRQYAFNCIDREVETEGNLTGQNWCMVNKHTKLLKIGSTGLQSLLDVRDNCGNLQDYDINYKKTGSGKKGTRYNAMKAENNPNVFVGPLTDEEKAYEVYTLKREGALSPARYVLKYLAQTIARIDGVLGTKYLAQLEEQAKLEASMEGEPGPGPNPQQTTPPPAQSRIPPAQTQTVVTEVQTQAPPVEPINTTPPPGPSEQQAPPEQQVPPPEQQAVKTRGSADTVKMIVCPFCKAHVPSDSVHCTNDACKKKLLEACDEPSCRKLFLVTLDTCPHCGKTYKLG